MGITAKQAAELIGVSQATLSLVVNRKTGISEKTRRRVLEALHENGLDYLLKQEEDTGAQGENGMIGFVIYRAEGKLLGYDSFFPLIMDGIERCARESGFCISFITIDRDEADRGIRRIREAGCSGVVIFATEMQQADLAPFVESRIPFVLLDNHFFCYELNTVEVDNEQGTWSAVNYLRERGHAKVGYLSGGVDINSFHDRRMYALSAMRSSGMEEPEQYSFTIGYPVEEAYEGMKRCLMDHPVLPEAFLADNDLVIAGAMKALKEAGYRIPEDISLIGFDDRPICALTEPPMTTIAIPREEFGAEAVRVLLRLMRGEEVSLRTLICGELVKGKSVAMRR